MEIENELLRKDGEVILSMSKEDYLDLLQRTGAPAYLLPPKQSITGRLMDAFKGMEEASPDVQEAMKGLRPDVLAVVEDFEKDYRFAVANVKEAYVSMLTWARYARDQLQLEQSYLEAEKLRDDVGLNSGNPSYTPYSTGGENREFADQ